MFAFVCAACCLAAAPPARAACPEGEDLDIQLRDKEVQRQLILSGFLAAEIGRANERLLRAAVLDFRAANIFPAPIRPCSPKPSATRSSTTTTPSTPSSASSRSINPGQPAEDDLPGRPAAAGGQAVDRELAGVREPAGQPRRHRRVPRVGARVLHQLVLARLPVLQRADAHLHPQLRLGDDRRGRRQPLGIALLLPQHDVRVSGWAARHLHPLRHEAAGGLRAAAGDPAGRAAGKDQEADRQALHRRRRRCAAADREPRSPGR